MGLRQGGTPIHKPRLMVKNFYSTYGGLPLFKSTSLRSKSWYPLNLRFSWILVLQFEDQELQTSRKQQISYTLSGLTRIFISRLHGTSKALKTSEMILKTRDDQGNRFKMRMGFEGSCGRVSSFGVRALKQVRKKESNGQIKQFWYLLIGISWMSFGVWSKILQIILSFFSWKALQMN